MFSFQLPLHASEATNHSPLARLRAKKVGCPQPDFPRVPATVRVPSLIGWKSHAPSWPQTSYFAVATSNGASFPTLSPYPTVFQSMPDQGDSDVIAVDFVPRLVMSSQRTITEFPCISVFTFTVMERAVLSSSIVTN